MSIKITDIAIQQRIDPWSITPGHTQSAEYQKTPGYAQKAFKIFVDKIPGIKKLITQLRQEKLISEVHLPLPLSTIFFLFLDELIEVYQNGHEQRDLDIDHELQNIKRVCAKKCEQGWDKGPKELIGFFSEIKGKLNAEGILPPNFDTIINIWREVLNIKYAGTLVLASLFDKNAESNRLMSSAEIALYEKALIATDDPSHPSKQPPIQVVAKTKKTGGTRRPNELCYSLLSRYDLEQSFLLLLQQINRDASWILPELLQKIPPIENKELELDVRALIAGTNSNLLSEPISVFTAKNESRHREFIEKLKLTDINNNESIKSNNELFSYTDVICDHICNHTFINKIKKNGDDNSLIAAPSGRIIKVTDALIQHLEGYNDCCSINKYYLLTTRYALIETLVSLTNSNRTWEQFNETKKTPLLYSQVQPLLPPICEVNDQWIDALEPPSKSTPSRQPPQVSKKKKPRNPATRPKKTVPLNSINQAVDTPISEIQTPAPFALNPLERLKLKLQSLHQASPSCALRQALWHLDALTVIQSALPHSKVNAPYCLSMTAIVIASSQKVLEQTYRFCLKQDSSPLERNHNLKVYHRELEPGGNVFPQIVKELFLANTWHRYFYIEHKKWNALKMNLASTPPVLNLLVKIAEGQALSPKELDSFVEATIEDVRKHTEFLLENTEAPLAKEGNVFQPSETKEPLLKNAPFNGFDSVSNALNQILKKTKLPQHHSVLLHIKQALAAFKMLKVSQEKIAQAKDVQTFSIWTVWSLQQMQESMENVLRAIEHLQTRETSVNHEMEALALKVGLDLGPLAAMYQKLSYKTRYPAEVVIGSLPAEIIDDLEAIKQFPEILDGFKLQNLPNMLWSHPREGLTLEAIAKKLSTCMIQSEEFLRLKAIPLLAGHD